MLEEVIIGTDFASAAIGAVLVTIVTAWATDWVALHVEGWAVPLNTVGFGFANLQLLMVEAVGLQSLGLL